MKVPLISDTHLSTHCWLKIASTCIYESKDPSVMVYMWMPEWHVNVLAQKLSLWDQKVEGLSSSTAKLPDFLHYIRLTYVIIYVITSNDTSLPNSAENFKRLKIRVVDFALISVHKIMESWRDCPSLHDLWSKVQSV